MYVYRIRRATKYIIDDLLNDKVSASTPECFDDETEMEWYCNIEKVADEIIAKKKLGLLTQEEYNNILEFDKNNGKEDFLHILNEAISEKDVPQKKSLWISCFSKINNVDNEEMWDSYTGHKPFEGIMLVYDTDDLISKCNNIKYGDIKYNSRKELDLTNYWIDWVYCFCKYVDKNKKMIENKFFVDSKLNELHHTYVEIEELVFTKNEDWKWQNEWRIAKENPYYNYEKCCYYIDEKCIFNQKDLLIDKCKYGYTVKAKPIAIYIRKHVHKKYEEQIVKYANANNIKLFFEKNCGDFERIKKM